MKYKVITPAGPMEVESWERAKMYRDLYGYPIVKLPKYEKS